MSQITETRMDAVIQRFPAPTIGGGPLRVQIPIHGHDVGMQWRKTSAAGAATTALRLTSAPKTELEAAGESAATWFTETSWFQPLANFVFDIDPVDGLQRTSRSRTLSNNGYTFVVVEFVVTANFDGDLVLVVNRRVP